MTFEEDVAQLNIKNIIIGAIISGLGFLVALTWRDALQEFINSIIPNGNGLGYKIIAAMLVTIFSVFVGYFLVKVSEKSISETFKKKNYGNYKVKKVQIKTA